MAFQNINLECRGCGAAISLDPTLRFATCPYCGNQNSLVPKGKSVPPPAVEQIYPARFSEPAFRSAVRAFLYTHPDVPDSLYESLEERELALNFWPFFRQEIDWTANWTANIGYDDESAKDGIAWQVSSGQSFGTSVVYAPAASILDRRDLGMDGARLAAENQSEPLQFDPDLLEGISYLTCDLETQAVEKRYVAPVLDDSICEECANQIPGDHKRNLRKTFRINDRRTTLQMIPYWLFVYDWDGKSYFVMQNAASGAVSGTLPSSSRRKWIARGLTAAGFLLAGGLGYLVWKNRSDFDGVLFLALTLPLAMAGGIYRNHISSRKSRIKLAPVSEIGTLLKNLKQFEKKFLLLTSLAMILWSVASLGIIAVLPVVLPFWRDPITLHEPNKPEKPLPPSEKRKQEKKVIKLKLRKVSGLVENTTDEDGNVFTIVK